MILPAPGRRRWAGGASWVTRCGNPGPELAWAYANLATERMNQGEHVQAVTRREQEVLELICEGLTNDEISGRLLASVKTVGHHVSAVLGQLGVLPRRVAAAKAARLRLVRTAAR